MLLVSTCQAEVLLQDLQGKNIPFSELKGKWVLINYWAGWCQTCVNEIPEFNRFYKSHKNDPVALFAVNYDALPLFEQQTLIRKLNINYPNLIKSPANDLKLGEISGVPMTFIINPEGKLVKVLYGGQTARSLNKAMTNA
ncbi:MAG: TlpA disulfide reductase family protein [Legionella sp.]